jgi:OmcA/MtrC family decaheme c-type cytochrome
MLRAGVATAQCNTCHDPLRAHGSRFEVRLCITCHTEASVDELGRSIDFRNMVHKIHAGAALPSVADGPPGSFYGIYSSFGDEDVVFARKDEDGVVTGVQFPRPLSDCTACHADAPTADYHRQKPSAAACSSCHDDVNASLDETAAGPSGTNHFQERGYPDGQCAACHEAELREEFDITVPGAHVIPERSSQLAGLNLSIDGIADHLARQTPLVTFKITDDSGAPLTDLSGLNRVAFVLAGPTDDYAHVLVANAVGGGSTGTLTGPNSQGQFEYRLPAPLPDDAAGTWALGAEARRSVMVDGRSVSEAAPNPVVTFATDSSPAAMRRQPVVDANCTTCHGEFSKGFSIHGNLRNRVEYCVLCHSPNETDFARRGRDPEAVAAGDSNQTIDFKVMIHKIHRGEDLAQHPYVLYGFGAAPENFTAHDFSHLLYPGNLSNCETCHTEDSYTIPPFPGPGALGALLTAIDPLDGSEVELGRLGPVTSVCTSCHDSDASMAHAFTQTADSGDEACAVCHGEGRPQAVSELHAQ